MANQNSQVRFDTREIAVIFSLFIFVSLLMFTVGILVGKGLAQARYEGTAAAHESSSNAGEAEVDRAPTAINTHDAPSEHPVASTSVTTETKPEAHAETHAAAAPAPTAKAEATEHQDESSHAQAHEPKTATAAPSEHVTDESATLELVPKKPKNNDVKASLQDFPKTAETEGLFKNPRTKDIFESDPKAKKVAVGTGAMVEKDFTKGERSPASVRSAKIPTSLPEGKYTVQVGSYSEQKEAADRVESLKKMGFPFAYFSANEIKERNEIWYRVWLGYYSDHDSAKSSGEILKARGEVKNFLVRKMASESSKN